MGVSPVLVQTWQQWQQPTLSNQCSKTVAHSQRTLGDIVKADALSVAVTAAHRSATTASRGSASRTLHGMGWDGMQWDGMGWDATPRPTRAAFAGF